MKFSVLLLALFASLVAGCTSKKVDPKPTAASTEATASSIYLEFRLFDAGDGDQFNATLNARVYYFPLSWSESQISTYFGNPATNDQWNDEPRPADEEVEFGNTVGPYGWSADPGFIHLDLATRQQIAIVWTFPEADPRARRGYRQQLFIWDGQGENQVLKTDRFRAGL